MPPKPRPEFTVAPSRFSLRFEGEEALYWDSEANELYVGATGEITVGDPESLAAALRRFADIVDGSAEGGSDA